MDRRVCQSIIKHEFVVFRKQNAVDKGNSSSTQVNWASRCCHSALCADLFALNVTLRRCTMGGGEVHKTYKLQTFIACHVHGRRKVHDIFS